MEKRKIAFIEDESLTGDDFLLRTRDEYNVHIFRNGIMLYDWLKNGGFVDAIVSAGKPHSPSGLPLLEMLRADPRHGGVPFLFVVQRLDQELKMKLLSGRVTDILDKNFTTDDFCLRMNYLIDNPLCYSEECLKKQSPVTQKYTIPLGKRIFDIFFASLAILMLSPLLLLVIILIKLESKGPIFYISKRVGTGYNIFNFYKFRSMRRDADAKLKEIAHLNQYKKKKDDKLMVDEKTEVHIPERAYRANAGQNFQSMVDTFRKLDLAGYLKSQYNMHMVGPETQIQMEICSACRESGRACDSVLFLDGQALCENVYLESKKNDDSGKFIKISNDPRVTRVGKIIRNTSIDELPQLFNVLKGDMSIVGNRPLPLYEAEKITSDSFSQRFLAPAGITGLWQVTKRGGKDMSEEERMELDNEYARNYSLWYDIKLILRTIPALFQKDNV